MHNYNSIADEIAWLLHGPELALGLFSFLFLYTIALRGTTARAQIPGLGWLTRRTIYGDLVLGLGLLATVPAIALALVLTSRTADQRAETTADLLNESTTGIATRLDEYLEKHQAGIASLVTSIESAGRLDVYSLTEWLESHHSLSPDYLTMLAADALGEILTATTMVHGHPERIETINNNIRNRDYFIAAMRDSGIYVSEVFEGSRAHSDPIIAVSAPLHDRNGAIWGIVEGSLKLESLSRFSPTGQALSQGANLLILDQRNRVLFSSTPGRYTTLETISAGQLMDTDRSRLYSHAESSIGWRVIASVSTTPIHELVWADARISLLWLLAAILVAVMLSAAIARRVTRPLAALNRAVRALDLEGTDADITPPAHASDEIREVFGYLNSMSERLHNSYRQLTAAIEAGKHYREQLETTLARREAEISSRTQELESSNRNLRTLSHVDPLTGLANRRRFTETADQLWRHAVREQNPISIIIMDIDNFKAFNDTYGHQAGDDCLVQIGAALSTCLMRPLDFVARYGGEEFIMILANTDLAPALAIAERTRLIIEQLQIPHTGSQNGSIVTMSLGVAAERPRHSTHYDALIRSADRALYHAKEMGRNCVAYSSEEKIAVHRDGEQPSTTTGESDDVLQFRRPVNEEY